LQLGLAKVSVRNPTINELGTRCGGHFYRFSIRLAFEYCGGTMMID
jgi:hypothetical protein